MLVVSDHRLRTVLRDRSHPNVGCTDLIHSVSPTERHDGFRALSAPGTEGGHDPTEAPPRSVDPVAAVVQFGEAARRLAGASAPDVGSVFGGGVSGFGSDSGGAHLGNQSATEEPLVEVFGEGGLDSAGAPADDATAETEEDADGGSELTKEEKLAVAQMKARDAEVRAHEQAHKAAGGSVAGSIHYEYQRGPDNQRYAVGGEVSIDVSAVAGDPQATLRKMQVVQRAASAPANRSGADRSIASAAAATAQKARAEIVAQRYEENSARTEESDTRSESRTDGTAESSESEGSKSAWGTAPGRSLAARGNRSAGDSRLASLVA